MTTTADSIQPAEPLRGEYSDRREYRTPLVREDVLRRFRRYPRGFLSRSRRFRDWRIDVSADRGGFYLRARRVDRRHVRIATALCRWLPADEGSRFSAFVTFERRSTPLIVTSGLLPLLIAASLLLAGIIGSLAFIVVYVGLLVGGAVIVTAIQSRHPQPPLDPELLWLIDVFFRETLGARMAVDAADAG
jgi:hypothetical protein